MRDKLLALAALQKVDLDIAALKKNAEFAVGGLGLKDGKYYLFYSVPLEDLSEDEFDVPLHVIARSADALEATYSGGDDDH